MHVVSFTEVITYRFPFKIIVGDKEEILVMGDERIALK